MDNFRLLLGFSLTFNVLLIGVLVFMKRFWRSIFREINENWKELLTQMVNDYEKTYDELIKLSDRHNSESPVKE